MVPSLFTTTTPCLGADVIETLEVFKVPPEFPAASLAKIFTVVGTPGLAVAISLFATGLSVTARGSSTVISKGETGQPVV